MVITELLSKVPLFEGISPEDRAALARAATLRTYRRGETIVQQGQPGDAFYVLVRGRVAVAIVAPDGREVVLNTLGEGDHFGEMALLDDAPRSASVIAQEKSDLAILSRAVFFDLLKSNFVLTRALLAAFSARLRRANATIEGLASLDVKSRLARYFRELAAARGRKAGGGWAVVVRPSQREIADTIGSSRETVSRTMSQMAAEQLIVPKGKAVYVKLDPSDAETPPPGRPGSTPAAG
jgi:CRP/FNR family transcriptional regulator, cyclic AMP receptor protein